MKKGQGSHFEIRDLISALVAIGAFGGVELLASTPILIAGAIAGLSYLGTRLLLSKSKSQIELADGLTEEDQGRFLRQAGELLKELKEIADDVRSPQGKEQILRMCAHTRECLDYLHENPESSSQSHRDVSFVLEITIPVVKRYSLATHAPGTKAREQVVKFEENVFPDLVTAFEQMNNVVARGELFELGTTGNALLNTLKQQGLLTTR